MGDAADVSFSPVGTGEPLLLVETLGAIRGLALPSAEGYIGLLQRGRLGLMIPLDQLHIDNPMRDPPDFICMLRLLIPAGEGFRGLMDAEKGSR